MDKGGLTRAVNSNLQLQRVSLIWNRCRPDWRTLSGLNIRTQVRALSSDSMLRGLSCPILGHTVPYWAILSHTGPYCPILGHTVPYWVILSHTGPYCPILGHTWSTVLLNSSTPVDLWQIFNFKSSNNQRHRQTDGENADRGLHALIVVATHMYTCRPLCMRSSAVGPCHHWIIHSLVVHISMQSPVHSVAAWEQPDTM